jgi:hypothetical protein
MSGDKDEITQSQKAHGANLGLFDGNGFNYWAYAFK